MCQILQPRIQDISWPAEGGTFTYLTRNGVERRVECGHQCTLAVRLESVDDNVLEEHGSRS
jgi:hypothetical protein